MDKTVNSNLMLESVTNNTVEMKTERFQRFYTFLDVYLKNSQDEKEKKINKWLLDEVEKIKTMVDESVQKCVNIRKAQLVAQKNMEMKNKLIYHAIGTLYKPYEDKKEYSYILDILNRIIPKAINDAGEELYKTRENVYNEGKSIMIDVDKSGRDINDVDIHITNLTEEITKLETENSKSKMTILELENKVKKLNNDLKKQMQLSRKSPLLNLTIASEIAPNLIVGNPKDQGVQALEKVNSLLSVFSDSISSSPAGKTIKNVHSEITKLMNSNYGNGGAGKAKQPLVQSI